MAVTVINGGVFTKTDGDRPGLYVRFIEKAIATIGVGARSKVAIIKTVFDGGTAVTDKIYRVTSMEQAATLFGSANTVDIGYIFTGGASEVIVSTITPATPASGTPWINALQRLETYEFHVYVNTPGADSTLDTAAFTWLQASKTAGMNFIAVFAEDGTEGNVTTIKAAAAGKTDEYVVFVGGGVKDAAGTVIGPEKFAAYVGGLIAGTPLDGSLTYREIPYAETVTRFRTTEVKELLAAGVLVPVMDGDQPRIEQGLTLGEDQFSKIRTVRAKQAMIDDIDKAVQDNYVGKITNNINGQVAVVNAIKAYLTTLADGNVIAPDFLVEIDTVQPSVGSDLYINLSVRFLDSIEYVYLTISV